MKLNPKTAAKQFLRKQEQRTVNNQKRNGVQNADAPSLLDKWSTGMRRVIRNVYKVQAKDIAYMEKITVKKRYATTNGKFEEHISFVDRIVNTNKFTNDRSLSNQ